MTRTLPTTLKLILDFAPLAIFFIGYKLGGVQIATECLVATTALCLGIIYAVERKIAIAPLLTGCIVAIFGGLTLWLKDDYFIKIKPTLIYGTFATILLSGVYIFKRGLLNRILGLAVEMTDEGWLKLSRRWGFFFLGLAITNEIVWRNFSTDFWVDFKVFGMFGLTILFAMSQVGLMLKHKP